MSWPCRRRACSSTHLSTCRLVRHQLTHGLRPFLPCSLSRYEPGRCRSWRPSRKCHGVTPTAVTPDAIDTTLTIEPCPRAPSPASASRFGLSGLLRPSESAGVEGLVISRSNSVGTDLGIWWRAVNGDRAEADLATSGEVDTYHFEVASAATHIMTTEGPSDTVLTSHGSADPGAVLAWDDDRGSARQRPHRAKATAGRVLAVRAP